MPIDVPRQPFGAGCLGRAPHAWAEVRDMVIDTRYIYAPEHKLERNAADHQDAALGMAASVARSEPTTAKHMTGETA
ncbi:MAG: hypothetical protein M1823_003588 [Watsoniomyces obsoletus]|nr:MAG: hypothetical protein M1823_003588 [Watsoniomyces obsoletus]